MVTQKTAPMFTLICSIAKMEKEHELKQQYHISWKDQMCLNVSLEKVERTDIPYNMKDF